MPSGVKIGHVSNSPGLLATEPFTCMSRASCLVLDFFSLWLYGVAHGHYGLRTAFLGDGSISS